MENTTVIVYRLRAGCDLSDVEEGKTYQAKVQGFATFWMFAQINDRIKGLVHKSNIKAEHKEQDPILVRVRQIRPNGNIDLEEVLLQVDQVQAVDRKSTTVNIADLRDKVGKTVAIEGEISQIKQTSGPTIFTIVDETGTQNAAAFIEAGVRAYPEAELDNIVKIIGEVMMRNIDEELDAAVLVDRVLELRIPDADPLLLHPEPDIEEPRRPAEAGLDPGPLPVLEPEIAVDRERRY